MHLETSNKVVKDFERGFRKDVDSACQLTLTGPIDSEALQLVHPLAGLLEDCNSISLTSLKHRGIKIENLFAETLVPSKCRGHRQHLRDVSESERG
jgi:hypothetical protein